ncbi:MAG: mandelate racemase/muconate lactonizing enzyme family protein [Opitutaceae bacterium]|nr:mandelate racemase/muconate lactonizing enzyme family protein [Opitutaceae bacterium]
MPKIKKLHFFRAVSPLSRPLADSTHQLKEIGFIILKLETDTGVTGESYLLSFNYSPFAIAGALEDIRAMAEGWEISATGEFIRHFERESEYFGLSGIHRWALGLVNIAMWDAWAKHLGQPVWRLFGVCHSRVPLYGSGGWISYSLDELISEVTGYVRRGFRAVKIKVGSPELSRDIERLTRVREAVGPSVAIMMDANQGMTALSAQALANAVRALQITWFEEPLPHTDFDGYATLRRGAGMAIAMGEREFDLVTLRKLIHRQAIDLWQPDILRLGSVEAWRESAALAHAHHIPVLPHYYKEYDVPLLMTVPNAFGAESFDWVDPLLSHPIRMENGFAYPTDRPGWGFTFKEQSLTELRVAVVSSGGRA